MGSESGRECSPALPKEVQDEVEARLLEAARDGRVACAVALSIGETLNVPPIVIGRVADGLKLKFNRCQLGCFK